MDYLFTMNLNLVQRLNTVQSIINFIRGIKILNQEEIELKILRSVDKVTSQRTIADEIGYSLGKVNYVLKNLIDKGLIKTQRFVNSENKIQYKYLLTPKGIKEKIEITEKFIAIKKAEYDELQKELEVLKGLGGKLK